MANFWSAGTWGDLTVNQPVSLALDQQEDRWILTVCDPTKENTEALEVTIHEIIYIEETDKNVQLTHRDGQTNIVIKWQAYYGQALSYKFKVKS